MRNLVKVQMVNVPVTNENPRIRITETTTKEIEIEAENMNTRSEDVDVVEMVLSITGNAGSNDAVAKDFKVSAPVPIENAKVIDTAQVDDPRSSSEGFQADSTDPSAEIRGPAPHAGTPTYLPGNVDTDVFTPGTGLPDGYNEIGTFPTFRPYNEVTGQYGIAERRPYQNPQKRELADFISIDDKITTLKKGIAISPNPPPNFDEVMPPFASKNVAMA
jgi:hypothetical protein